VVVTQHEQRPVPQGPIASVEAEMFEMASGADQKFSPIVYRLKSSSGTPNNTFALSFMASNDMPISRASVQSR
jgi:hypothetical protein